MAKQLDLYKAINKHAKAIKVLEKHVKDSNDLVLMTYDPEMRVFITRKLVKQWHRYLVWLKVKRFLGFKKAKALTDPISIPSARILLNFPSVKKQIEKY